MTNLLDTATVLRSPDASAEFSFFKQGGGMLNHLVLRAGKKSLSLLPSYDNLEELSNNFSYRCVGLFPFPNRLRDGKYSFEGVDYQFPINEKGNNNNLHGFLKELTPQVEVKGADSSRPGVLTRYSYDGARSYYPFPSEVTIEYILESTAELRVVFQVRNTGKGSMPVGTGWHPYFQLGEKVDNLYMKMPQSERVLIDERMIPTGKTQAFTDFDKWAPIASTKLDDCFIPAKGGVEEVAVLLWSEKAGVGIEVWQDTNYGFIQIYTPPNRESIAIEPMSCNINAFQSSDGLSVLAAGESFTGEFGVRMITSK